MSDKQQSIQARKVVTPKFRLSYPNLWKAKAMEVNGKPQGDPKFSITMLFDKDEDLSKMKKAVQYAAVEAWGKDKAKWPKKYRMPFRDGDEEKPDRKEYEGKIFVSASSKAESPPGVYDQQKKPISEGDGKIKAGDYARASLIAFAYNVAGNQGISFALLSVQKWETGESLGGGRTPDDFDDSLEDQEDEPEDMDSDDDDFDFGDDDDE